ncbi:MAG TPA: hypothetical protein VJJ52_05080 [Candidatus Nanoarchaeia archaeon]|nr:hypothetical protein [Candidatus Nanoarchaeia archaeon]
MSNLEPDKIISQLQPTSTCALDKVELERRLEMAHLEFDYCEKKLRDVSAEGSLSDNVDWLFSKMENVIRSSLAFQQRGAAYGFTLRYIAARQQYAIH